MFYRILYLYPDLLDLYGDSGNIEILKYRLEKRGIKCVIDTYSVLEDKPDFDSYNLIFMGGGADREHCLCHCCAGGSLHAAADVRAHPAGCAGRRKRAADRPHRHRYDGKSGL